MIFARRTEQLAADSAPRRLRPANLMLAAALLCGPAAAAQSPIDGTIRGSVEDGAHHAVAAAQVAIENLDTGERRRLVAGRDGVFVAAHLAPGSYAVAIRADGLAEVRSVPLQVALEQTTEVQAILRSPASASSISAHTGVEPPASAIDLPDQDDDGLLSVRGLASTQNSALLDGAGVIQSYASVPVGSGADPAPDPDSDSDSAELTTGPANGLARGRHAGASYTFSQSAVREFRTGATGSYSAQTGSAGAVATTVSRSGTAQFHGSAGLMLRSQAFAATNPLSPATNYSNGVVTSAPVKPHDLREAFIATLAGPIPRTRDLLFFESFDLQRRGFPAISSPADPNFYSLTATQRALLANRGVTSSAENTALNYLASLTGETPRRADQNLNFVRFDWNRHPRLKLAAHYNALRWNSPAGLLDAPVVARGRASLGNADGSLDSVLLRATSLFSAKLITEAHFAFTRDLQYETPQTPLPQEAAISPGGLAPEVNIGPNGLLFGTPATLSQLAYPDERRIELADTLTLARGRHLFSIGATVAFFHDTVATQPNSAGTFRYDSGVTKGFAGGLVDFLTDFTFNVNAIPNGGCPAITATTHDFCFRSFTQSFGVQSIAFSTQDWAGFVEDTWRLRPTLTLHAGARYEYTLLPIPANPNPTLDAIFGARGATGVFPEDRNNLGPRAALAWEPFGRGRGTMHLGYGIFFGRLPGATIRAALVDTAQPGGTSSIRITPTAVINCPQISSPAPAQGFGYPCAFLSQPSGVVAATTSALVFDRRFRLPVVQQGSLSIARTISRSTTLSAGYVLNLDRQLASSTDLNIAPSTQAAHFQLQGGTGAPGVSDGEAFSLPLYTARLTPSFGPVTDVVSNVNATYHALILEGDSHLLRSLQVQGSYTWSKAIDYGQAQSATPRTNSQLDPFTNGYDKALSSLNYPWATRLSATWQPAPPSNQAWLRALTSHWQLTPILSARAGRPYSFDLSGGTRLSGGHESLNSSGGALYLPTVGRNTLRLPASTQVDLRAARGFRIAQRYDLRLSAEAFNLLNHRNLSSVTQRAFLVGTAVSGVTPLVFQNAATIASEGLNTQPFGTPTAASSSLARERQVQLGLSVQF